MTDMGERIHLRPGRALMEGVPYMFDFMGELSQERPTRSVDEEMALTWRDVLSVIGPPPPAGPGSPRSENSAADSSLRPVGW